MPIDENHLLARQLRVAALMSLGRGGEVESLPELGEREGTAVVTTTPSGILNRLAQSRLTPAESRVAELVSEGLANAEVASRLFMSQRTVESHLSHVFRKLGVSTRTEMTRRLLVP